MSSDVDTGGDELRVVREGERVCCCGRAGARQARSGKWNYWTGKVYEAKARQHDGLLTWRLVDTYGGTRAGREPSRRFLDELRRHAPHPWTDEPVRHGELVMPIAVEGGAI